MYETEKNMAAKYRETANSGLAKIYKVNVLENEGSNYEK